MSSGKTTQIAFYFFQLFIWLPCQLIFIPTTTKEYRYFLTIIDDGTRFTWMYLLQVKSDVTTVFPGFFSLIYSESVGG